MKLRYVVTNIPFLLSARFGLCFLIMETIHERFT